MSMSWTRFHAAMDAFVDHEPPPPDNVSHLPYKKRRLNQDDIDGFHSAAEDRIWNEIEQVLRRASRESPLRARQVRHEIKWLRRQAWKQGVSWGRRR